MTDNALAVRYTATDGTEVALDAQSIRKYVFTGKVECSDAELVRFMAICQARGLNPLAGDAYLVKYRDDQDASTIVSKDYYTRTAHQKPSFDGYDAGIIVEHDGKTEKLAGSFVPDGARLVGGWAKVYDKDHSRPFEDTVALSEYTTGKSSWSKMPATMIRKVALVHALREAYPESFGGLYTSEEMEQAREDTRTPLPIETDAVVVEPVVEPEKAAPRQLTPEQRSTLQNITHLQAERLGVDEGIVKQEMMRAIGNPLDAESFDDYVHAAEAWALEEMPTEVVF